MTTNTTLLSPLTEALTLRTARALVQVRHEHNEPWTVHVTVMQLDLGSEKPPAYFTLPGNVRTPSREAVHAEVVARMGWEPTCRVEVHDRPSGNHYFMLYGN